MDGLTENTHSSIIKYGIEAELSDGKIVKTNTLGGKLPWEDLDIKVVGGIYSEEGITVEEDASKIPNDKISITAKSKYHNVSDATTVDVLYNKPIKLEYNGGGNSIYRYNFDGMSGYNFIIKAVRVKTAKGTPVTKMEIIDATNNKVLHRYKVTDATSITLYTNGQNGSDGNEKRSGGNGGNGGDITVYADPSVTSIPLIVHNNAGRGGPNKYRGVVGPGKDGRQGKYNVIKQSVNLNW